MHVYVCMYDCMCVRVCVCVRVRVCNIHNDSMFIPLTVHMCSTCLWWSVHLFDDENLHIGEDYFHVNLITYMREGTMYFVILKWDIAFSLEETMANSYNLKPYSF